MRVKSYYDVYMQAVPVGWMTCCHCI